MIVSKIEMMLSKVLAENNPHVMCNPFAKRGKKYFSNLDPKFKTGTKEFWKSIKPIYSDETNVMEVTNLTENREILSSDNNIADTFHAMLFKISISQ